MIRPKRPSIIILIFISSIMLCGCPPIRYTFFVRNTTTNTVNLTLKMDENTIKKTVRFKKELIKINNKTFSALNDSLAISSDNKNIRLNIPMKSTVLINDFFGIPFFIVPNKTLFIQSGNKTDSLKLIYPYRKTSNKKKTR